MAPSNGYGTLSNNEHAENGTLNGIDSERAALLGKPGSEDGLAKRFRRHMACEVSKTWGDLMLLGCYIITGLLDSSSVQVWGSFVSMQTGNTIYFGLGLAAPHDSSRWIRAGISIASFALGSFVFARYHRYCGGRKRWVLVSAYLTQLVMIVGAALMVKLGPKTGAAGPVSVWVGVPIALIAFQSAGQAVTSRVLGYNALTSVVLTSIYCDLFSDPKVFSGWRTNVERNRRVGAAVCVAFGAFLGGLWAHSEEGLAAALWTAVVLKGVVVIGWMLWKTDPESA